MTYSVATAASGQDVVMTLPAQSDKYYIIENLIYSYSGLLSLGAGGLKFKFGSTVVLDFDIKSDLLGNFLDLVGYAYQSEVNQAVEITLKGVTGAVGKLSLIHQEV